MQYRYEVCDNVLVISLNNFTDKVIFHLLFVYLPKRKLPPALLPASPHLLSK